MVRAGFRRAIRRDNFSDPRCGNSASRCFSVWSAKKLARKEKQKAFSALCSRSFWYSRMSALVTFFTNAPLLSLILGSTMAHRRSSVGAFPDSPSPFHWAGVIITESNLLRADVPVFIGIYDPFAAKAILQTGRIARARRRSRFQHRNTFSELRSIPSRTRRTQRPRLPCGNHGHAF